MLNFILLQEVTMGAAAAAGSDVNGSGQGNSWQGDYSRWYLR